MQQAPAMTSIIMPHPDLPDASNVLSLTTLFNTIQYLGLCTFKTHYIKKKVQGIVYVDNSPLSLF